MYLRKDELKKMLPNSPIHRLGKNNTLTFCVRIFGKFVLTKSMHFFHDWLKKSRVFDALCKSVYLC